MPSAADGARAWAALALAFAAAALLVSAVAAPSIAVLDWQPALAGSEPWRALTAPFVHYSALHLLANLAGAALVGALGWFAGVPWPIAAAWLVAWPLTQFGLLLRPDLLHYGGLSGVLHAGVACVGWQLAVHARGTRRAIGALVLAGLAIKVVSEAPWGAPLSRPPGWDITTAPFAHASGLVAGLCAAALCDALATLARRAPAGAHNTASGKDRP
ncbi:MAG TPA: rhombosortase [Caldimonas sp.]|nr:rhombosortase [Caldimonas sp.]HEX4232980.1 rhombosortase [Caldimonas sp.]